jgi:hypothetical protein
MIMQSKKDKSDENNVEYSDIMVSTLSNLLPGGGGTKSPPSQGTVLDGINWGAPKRRGLTIESMADALDAGLREKSWFVTGNIMPELFAENFLFTDPNVKLEGVEAYARGVNKVFNQQTSRMQVCSSSFLCIKKKHRLWYLFCFVSTSSK